MRHPKSASSVLFSFRRETSKAGIKGFVFAIIAKRSKWLQTNFQHFFKQFKKKKKIFKSS